MCRPVFGLMKTRGLNEALRLITRVGGFLGRKDDGEPGVKTIRQEMQEVCVAALTLQALRDEGP